MSNERENQLDKMFDEVTEEYNRFHDKIGEIAIKYRENPYHVILSVLMGALETEKQNFEKAERCALACSEKVKEKAEVLGMPEELLKLILANNPDMARKLVKSVMGDDSD